MMKRAALLLIAGTLLLGPLYEQSHIVGRAQAAKKNNKKKASNEKNRASQAQRQRIQTQLKQITATIAAAKKALPMAQQEAADAEGKMQAAEARAQQAAAEFQRIKANQGDELELRKAENLLRAALTTRNRERHRLQQATQTMAAAQRAIQQGESVRKQLEASAKRLGSGKKKPPNKNKPAGKKKA